MIKQNSKKYRTVRIKMSINRDFDARCESSKECVFFLFNNNLTMQKVKCSTLRMVIYLKAAMIIK